MGIDDGRQQLAGTRSYSLMRNMMRQAAFSGMPWPRSSWVRAARRNWQRE
jgi:hypothetical protein